MRLDSTKSPLEQALMLARAQLEERDPLLLAANSEVLYQEGEPGKGHFRVRYFGEDYLISYPEGQVRQLPGGQEPSPLTQVILLHYLLTADGTPVSGEWRTFRQLPDGLLYDKTFRERWVEPIARVFADDLPGFIAAGLAAGGERARMADASFYFRVLPRLPMFCQLWLKDEELPASANILFDANAHHQLPTEDLSAVAGTLSRRLLNYTKK